MCESWTCGTFVIYWLLIIGDNSINLKSDSFKIVDDTMIFHTFHTILDGCYLVNLRIY